MMSRTLLAALLLAACGDVETPSEPDPQEVITTVVLSFMAAGREPVDYTWTDPENDGDPVVDPIVLSEADDYLVGVTFLNALEDPPEDITVEVEREADEHQVFFTGTALEDGLVTHVYEDQDENTDPVGLENGILTEAVGSGTLTVTLRHLPPQDGEPTKTEGLAALAASDGLEALPGESDASVTFDLTVE